MKKVFTWAALATVSLGTIGCSLLSTSQYGAPVPETPEDRVAASPNFRDSRFVNTVETGKSSLDFATTMRLLAQWFGEVQARAPQSELPVERLSEVAVSDGGAHVTWMGHSTLLIEVDGVTVLADPVFSDHASPYPWMPPKSYFPEMPITPEQIDSVDVVLISHDHYDHLDEKSIVALKDKARHFVVPLGVGAHLRHWGVEAARITELDWWQDTTIDGVRLTATPTRHFSGRRMGSGNDTLWAGWVITGASANVFFGGDSGYLPGFKEIGERLGPFNLTLLECGAYNEHWANVHMMPEQTAQAHRDLRGRALLPIHWGRFDLALHDWDEPIQRLLAAGPDLTIVQPRIGQRFALADPLPKQAWWRLEPATQTAAATLEPALEAASD